ncbi:4'-phosphopantetheinyl transferase superfamily protein [Streptomyces sp. L2]|uniref:4'-phosphopantetheinyl transferase family protein n=1 Tax=Streptomyces sp. L2 TaxID=2162665 RepID=UPI0010110F94|nr:4'-phosphopantetheinyl transferase superfamily protein [Streptomyces sp. L2]
MTDTALTDVAITDAAITDTGSTGTTAPALTVGEPLYVPGIEGPWAPVRQALRWHGHAVVHGHWQRWLPAALADPDLRNLLGGRDWERFSGLTDPTARSRFAASRLLVRHAVGAALSVDPGSVELSYKPGGRPYIRGCGQIELSLSHTRDLIVVALSGRGRIGVDTELSDRRVRYAAVERSLCSPAERARLAHLDEAARNRELLRIWTLKEAYTKALGQGMRLGFHQFGFGSDGELCGPDGRPAGHGEWGFGTHWLPDGYLISVARQDAGLGDSGGVDGADTGVATMLDEGFMGEIVELLGPANRPAHGGAT